MLKDKMNILNIVNSLEVGGLERLVVDMCKNQHVKNISTPIICSLNNIKTALGADALENNIPVYYFSKNGWMSYTKIIRELLKIIKNKKIDIIHTHNSVAHSFGVIASRLSGVPIVHTKHGNYIPQKFCLNYWTSRLAYHLSDKVVAVSEDTKKSIACGFNLSANRIDVVPNGINTEVFKPKNRISDPADKVFTIGCVGRLSPEKGHDLLLEAFALVTESDFSLKLLIAGKGVSEYDLRAKAKVLNITNHVEFLGERIDIPDLMKSFDIYAQTSLMEGMSLTLLEAMASGLPVVATNVGGNPEVVVDGVTGFLVPPKDPEKIAGAIIKILQNPELAKTMGTAGRKRVEEKFSLVRMVGDYKKLYEESLVNKGVNLKKQISLENAYTDQSISSKPKILVFTDAFPRSFEPNKGLAVKEEIEQLRRYFDIKIFSAIPHNLFSAKNNNMPQKLLVNDIEVFQPQYYTVPKIGIIFSGYSYYLAVKRMVEELHKRFSFNLILSYWAYPDGLAASICAKRFDVPLIIRPRGSDVNVLLKHIFLRKKLKALFKRADKIIPKSNDLQESIKDIGIHADKLSFIYNGIDLKEFRLLDKGECRKKLNMPFDKKIVLFVGNLLPIKGVSCLLGAIKVLEARKRSDLVFQILGSGKLEYTVRQAIKDLKFVTAVLPGEIPHKDLPVWINASDLVCITSLNEGCPNILLESLACGIPVVATKVGGIPEIINTNMLGILVPKNDIYTIADAIEEALKKRWEKELLRERVSGSSWDRVSEQLKDECLALTERVKQ